MAESIESFVTKLQNEGVQAGEAAAQKIRAQAEREARHLIEEAEARARQIVEGSKAEAQKTLTRARAELKLAARDTVLALQEALSRALREILVARTREMLSNPDFLKSVLHDLILEYVRADFEGKGSLVFNVSDQTRHQLVDWAIDELRKKALGRAVDLQAALAGAGFEYRVNGGTVEVTPESVVEVLNGLIGPELRRIVAEVAEGKSL